LHHRPKEMQGSSSCYIYLIIIIYYNLTCIFISDNRYYKIEFYS
jgi:hypothetical protein